MFEDDDFRQRLQEINHLYPKTNACNECDWRSYSYAGFAFSLFSIGAYITVASLGYIDGYLFSNLGHMWIVGPLLVCSGVMLGVRSVLYLRRKVVIKMVLRRCMFFRSLQQMSRSHSSQSRYESTMTLPPVYEALMGTAACELPPPSYSEALLMMQGSSKEPISTTNLE